MGGGALMTPVLVLFFNVLPLTAVSSDLVASAVMKPVGSLVHLRRGTVHLGLVKWLCVGSVPAAFAGVLVARALGGGEQVQSVIRTALAIALLCSAAGLMVRAYIRLIEHARVRDGRAAPLPQGRPRVEVRPFPVVVVGILGGLVVGMSDEEMWKVIAFIKHSDRLPPETAAAWQQLASEPGEIEEHTLGQHEHTSGTPKK